MAANTAPTFFTRAGIVTTNFGVGDDYGRSVVIQTDGKIVVAGYSNNGSNNDFALVRYNTDGSLDTSFSGDGLLTTAISTGDDEGTSVIMQSDGKIVVAGYSKDLISDYRYFTLVRYNTDGSLDTTFDTDGKLTTRISEVDLYFSDDKGYGVTLQPDGKILVAGHSLTDSGRYDFALVRYNTDGSLDTTFSVDGKLTTDISADDDYGYSVTLQSDGKILMAGFSLNGSDNDFTLVRYNSNGSPDTTFSGDGKVITDINTANDYGYSVIVQADGKILVAGFSNNGIAAGVALMRYNTDGSLDTTFSDDGKLTTSIGVYENSSVTLQTDGKILVANTSYNGSNYDFLLARFNTDGSLDTTFDVDGIQTTDIGKATDMGFSIIQQADGKILVTGSSSSGGSDFALVRYNTDGSLDSSFNPSINSLDANPSYTEGGSAVVLDSNVQIFDAELDALLSHYNGATLTLARNGGASNQDVFYASGTLGALTEGGNLTVGGITIGTVTTNSSGSLTLAFNAVTSAQIVSSALQQIAYSNNSNAPPASVQINWSFSDGNSGAQGDGGAGVATGSTTVSITAVNDAPTASNDTVTTNENTAAVLAATDFGTYADAESSPLAAVKITTLPAAGTLQYNSGSWTTVTLNQEITKADIDAGKLRFVPATDANDAGYATIGFKVSDGSDYSASAYTLTVDVTAVNDAPTIKQAISLSFADKVDYATGWAPVSVTTADVNNDGKTDLVVANYGSNTVSVLLGNGNGTFAAKVDYATGSNPMSVTSADVNGDGKADLLVANNSSNTVSVLLGNGNGTFAPKVDYATGGDPSSVANADVNGDGKADLLVANYGSNTVSVLLGNGNGTFAAKVDYATASLPASVASFDVNNDGKADLLVLNYSNKVSVLMNNGDGTFAAKVDYATGFNPYTLSSADVNGDGKADLLVANAGSNTVSVLLGNGNGTFAAKVDYATGSEPASVASTDINNDGKADLLVANASSNTVSVLLGNGDGTFAPKVDYITGSAPRSVTSADVNSDGKADLLVANEGSDTVSVLLNNGVPAATAFTEGANTPSTPVAVDTSLILADADSSTLASATVSITANLQSAEDTLAFSNTNAATFGNIAASYTSGTGVLALTSAGATATVAQWQAALRAVTYTNSSDTPNTSNRTISFVISDGTTDSAAITKTVSVTAVNDLPVITSGAAVNVAENTTAVTTVTSTDADADTVTYSITGGADQTLFSINANTGALAFATAPDYETPTDADSNNSYIVQVTANDGNGGTINQTITATVTNVADTNTAPTFFTRAGIVTTPIGTSNDYGRSVVVQPDGKLVVAGYSLNGSNNDFALVRYNADGSLDTSFSTDGMATTAIGSSNDLGYAVVLQPDGKILVAGYSYNGSNNDFALVRFNSDGSLDTTFSDDGKLTTVIGVGSDIGYSITVQTDGKILVAGSSNNGSNNDFALVRYNADGSLDTTFSDDGKLTTAIGAGADVGYSITAQADGKILVAGYSYNGSNNDVALVRYNANGTLDTGFDADGIVTTIIGAGADVANSIVVQTDGKIVVGGFSNNGTDNDFALVRYNTDGSLDTGFGTSGMVTIDFSVSDDYGRSVAIQSDGKIVVSGYSLDFNGVATFSLARYNTDGSLDASFGSTGIVTTAIREYDEYGYSIIIQSDGKLVVSGYSGSNGTNYDFVVVRYNSDGSLDSTFNPSINTLDATPTYTEDSTAVVLDSNVQIYDAELAVTNYNGATVTLARNGGASSQDVFSASGTLGALTQGANLTVGGTTIGTVTTNSSGTLTLIFNASATQTLVNSALQQIAYSNSSDAPPASVQLDWSFSDGNTGAQGAGGALATTGSTTVSITSVNSAPTFAVGNGKVTTPIGTGNDVGRSVVVQPDGKILVAGYGNMGSTADDFAVVRYNSDGTLDTSFSGDGRLTTDISTGNDRGLSIAVQPDGKIVVAGGSNDGFTLVRYNADGSLDISFSGDGKLTTAIGIVNDYGYSVTVQPDGKILVAGYSINGSNQDFALARYNSNGTLDTSFSGDGMLTTAIGTSSDSATSVAVQADGKIVVAGISYNGSNQDFAVVRYNADGTLDTSFSGDGMLTTDIGLDNDYGRSITVQPDGKILVAGYSYSLTNGTEDFALARYNSDGSLDTSFSGDGKLTTAIDDFGNDDGNSVTVQTDGKILVAGYANSDFALVRYNADGTLDTSFNTTGKVTTAIGTGYDEGRSVTVQADGKIVVAGRSNNGSNDDFALVRYNSDGSLDSTFNRTINTLDGAPAYTEGGAAVVLDSNVQIYDADLSASGNYNGATVTLARNGGASNQDVFTASGTLGALTQGANLTVGGTDIGTVTANSNGSLTLTFNASATQTLVNSAMQQIAYSNSSDAPPASVQLDWSFSDGNTGSQGAGGAATVGGSTTVTITGVNDLPAITSAAAVNVAENTTAVTTVTSSDADGDTVTYSITGGADQAKFSINANTGALVFATAPDYETPTDADSNNSYIVQVTADDSHGGTVNQTITATVTNVAENVAPVITSSAAVNVAENTTAVTTVTSTDADADTVTYSITGGADQAKFSIVAATGVLTFATAPNFEAPTDSDSNNSYLVQVTANDGHGGTVNQTITATVTDVAENAAPVITSSAAFNVAENTTAVTTVTATDADLDTITYSITGGADQAKFNINATTGALTFATAPNFEAPTDSDSNNSYLVQVTANDGNGGTVNQTITATVTNVAENTAPVITSAAAVNVAENTTAVTTVTSTDADADTVTYSITGGADQAKFSIVAATGVLTFATAPNFEAPTDSDSNNSYLVQVTANDGNGGTVNQTITATVTDVAENVAPVITSVAAVNVAENTTAVTTVTATDANGDTVTYSITGGADQAKFNINATTGALVFATAPNFEAPTDSDSNNSYLVQVTANDGHGGTVNQTITATVTNVAENAAPVITSLATFNVAENTTAVTTVTATDANADTVTYSITGGADQAKFNIVGATGALTFASAPNFEAPTDADTNNSYIVQVTANDGNGGTVNQTITATVTDVNENHAPIITSAAAVNVAENTTAVTTVTSTDADGDTVTYSISGGADQARFNINATSGALTFATAPNFEAPTDSDSNNSYLVQVTANDGNGGTVNQTITATVTNVAENAAPVITSLATFNVAENTTAVTTVTSTDANGDTVTYSISGGADQAKFNINATTGALVFASAPNFEAPTDSDSNNSYLVQVTANDGNGGTVNQTITATVTDVAENVAPVITSSAAVNVAENTTAVTTVTATDTNGDTVTYSITGGADQAKFNINATSGVLTFASAPNFEAPTDADSNNSYIVQVTANDGNGGTVNQTITATVTDVAENAAPVITSSAAVNVAENTTAVTTVTATDANADTVTYSITGGDDQAKFNIVAATGALTFATAPNFEAPTDSDSNNSYIVQVTANDGNGGTVNQTITATVTDVDETPVVDPPVIPPVDPPVVPPVLDEDHDGINSAVEGAVPSINGTVSVTGDGNGDGIADNQQVNVTSAPLLVPGQVGQQSYLTLVADADQGIPQAGSTTTITALQQQNRPAEVPSVLQTPLGMISFSSSLQQAGTNETFSLFVDSSLSVNGYWAEDSNGTWCNLATAIETVGNMTRIDFVITDGGAFDADGLTNGAVASLGAVGSMPLSITGVPVVMAGDGFWF